MNYHNITKDDMLNGTGLRVVLWLSGCDHHCEGCQNPQTWDYHSGIPFDDDAKQELFDDLNNDYIDGITFSGGDPLNYKNIREVIDLEKEIKSKFPDKSIWIYTGFTMDEIFNRNINLISKYERYLCDNNVNPFYIIKDLEMFTDVIVDGRFEKDNLSPNKPWVGSKNQTVNYLHK